MALLTALVGAAVVVVSRHVLSGLELGEAGRMVAEGLGLVPAVLAALTVIVLPWLLDPEIEEEPSESIAKVETFRELGNIDQLADQVAPLFWDREAWVHRRVEQVSFIDDTMTRRRISVDFEVPPLLEGDEGYRWLPLSVLRNWPPVLNFDLRSGEGTPLPLVSKAATNQLDERVLLGVAETALGGRVPEAMERNLRAIIHGDATNARRAFIVARDALLAYVEEHDESVDPEPFTRLLDLAAIFVDSTFLWVNFATDSESARRIVKLAYDEPVKRRLSLKRSLLTTLGLSSIAIDFDVPHVGDSGSYHLELVAPPGLEVIDARLVLDSDAPPGKRWFRLRRVAENYRARLQAQQRAAAGEPSDTTSPRTRYLNLLTSRAHLYLSGPRQRSLGAIHVFAVPQRPGVLTAALIVSALSAGILTAFSSLAPSLADAANARLVGPSVTFLLLAPGLLGYILLRPAEHAFVSRFLLGVRTLSVVAAMLPVGAAGLLIGVGAAPETNLLGWRDELQYLAWAIAGSSFLGWLLPVRRGKRRSD